jgi:DNA-binding transcriptional ArsR family regulator
MPDRNTLLVYWYMCSNTQSTYGPRTVQRTLGFSSPSTAVFHLEKLVDVGLVQKQRNGQYQVIRYKKFGLMKRFYKLGSWWIPKHLFYALLTTLGVMLILYLLFPLIAWLAVLASLPVLLSAAIQWYEAIVLLRERPSFPLRKSE